MPSRGHSIIQYGLKAIPMSTFILRYFQFSFWNIVLN